MKKTALIIASVVCIIGSITGICYGTGVFDNAKAQNPDSPSVFDIFTRPSPQPTAASASPQPITPDASSSYIEEDLKVELDSTKDYYPDVSWEFLDYQMVNQDSARVKASGLSDAVSFPFITKKSPNLDSPSESTYDYTYMFSQVLEEILRSPVYCDMVIRGMKDIKLSTGKTIGDLNPWMAEFVQKTDNFMKIDQNTHPRGMECWVTLRSGEGNKVFVSEEFRVYAIRTCLLLRRLVPTSVETWKSTSNYVLNYTATNSNRRTELASYQENRESLILCYVRKDAYADFSIGFNLADKRFEYFKDKGATGEDPYIPPVTPTPTPVPTPTPTPVPTNPPVNPTPVPTNPPVNPTPVPTPVPTEQPGTKNPEAGSYPQGHAPEGGHDQTNTVYADPTHQEGELQPEEPKFEFPTIFGSRDSGPRDTTPSTPTKSVVEGTQTTVESGKVTTVETKVDQNNTVVEKTTVTTPATSSTPAQTEVSTVFNPDPPPAAPAVVLETHYTDTSGNDVSISAEEVFSGEITLPD